MTETPPGGYRSGPLTVGTLGGVAGVHQFTNIVLGQGADGTGYNFAVEPPLASTADGSGPGDNHENYHQPSSAGAPAFAADRPRDDFFSRVAEALAGSTTDLPADSTGDDMAALVDLAHAVPGQRGPSLDPDGSSFQDRDRCFIALAAVSGVGLLIERKHQASPEA